MNFLLEQKLKKKIIIDFSDKWNKNPPVPLSLCEDTQKVWDLTSDRTFEKIIDISPY